MMSFDDFADDYSIQIPFFENIDDLFFASRFGDDEHSFLRFRKHHFIRRHAGFALRNKR